jgi:hypothetical protein
VVVGIQKYKPSQTPHLLERKLSETTAKAEKTMQVSRAVISRSKQLLNEARQVLEQASRAKATVKHRTRKQAPRREH